MVPIRNRQCLFALLEVDDEFPDLPESIVKLSAEEEERLQLPPTREEIQAIVKSMGNHKACGTDGIPVECFKYSDVCLDELTSVFRRAWEDLEIPQMMCSVVFAMIHKKGSVEICSNYRSIGLLPHATKIFTSVITNRIVSFLDEIFGENQNGFRPVRGTRDAMLAARHLLGKALDRDDTVLFLQIDYRAAFDSISHKYLMRSLQWAGVPEKLRKLISLIYSQAEGCIRTEEGNTEKFDIRRGVLQGEVLSPVLFILLLHCVLLGEGLDPFPDELTALQYIAYADDLLCFVHGREGAQEVLDRIQQAGKPAGLSIRGDKTTFMKIQEKPFVPPVKQILPEEEHLLKHKCHACGMRYDTKRGLARHQGGWCTGERRGAVTCGPQSKEAIRKHRQKALMKENARQEAENEEPVVIDEVEVEQVFATDYLGGRFDGEGDWRIDYCRREGMAFSKFNEFKKLLCSNFMSMNFRIRFFKVQVQSVLLYGSEVWPADAKVLVAKLQATNVKFARLLLRNRVTDENRELYERVKKDLGTAENFLRRKLKWLGELLAESVQMPGKERLAAKIAEGNRIFFESFLFGVPWEEARQKSLSEWDWDVLVEEVLLRAGVTEGMPSEGGTSESETHGNQDVSLSQETGDASNSSSDLWRLGNLEFSSEKEESGEGEAGLL
jgi:hypothetical protein